MNDNIVEFKIFTFNVYKDNDYLYAKSKDSSYLVGYTLEFIAQSREELHRQILLEINELFFEEYDIDFFASEFDLIEILLSKGIPTINLKEIN